MGCLGRIRLYQLRLGLKNCPVHFSVDEYIQTAKEKYGYNAEQALGMLFWHKHDLDRAIQV